jgi:hypothetical protein
MNKIRPCGSRRNGAGRIPVSRFGIKLDTMHVMAMTLRLDDQETEALRRRAELEGRSMQEVARQAVRDYIERNSKRELLDRVLDEELPRYAEALERLGQ